MAERRFRASETGMVSARDADSGDGGASQVTLLIGGEPECARIDRLPCPKRSPPGRGTVDSQPILALEYVLWS
jgi:hypothetical protein